MFCNYFFLIIVSMIALAGWILFALSIPHTRKLQHQRQALSDSRKALANKLKLSSQLAADVIKDNIYTFLQPDGSILLNDFIDRFTLEYNRWLWYSERCAVPPNDHESPADLGSTPCPTSSNSVPC